MNTREKQENHAHVPRPRSSLFPDVIHRVEIGLVEESRLGVVYIRVLEDADELIDVETLERSRFR